MNHNASYPSFSDSKPISGPWHNTVADTDKDMVIDRDSDPHYGSGKGWDSSQDNL